MLKQNKILLFISLMSSAALYSNYYVRLTGITNLSPYKVIVQTSETDKTGGIVLNNGKKQDDQQDREIDVRTIKSMNLAVPYQGWDRDATIHVRVYNENGNIRNQVAITDRDGYISFRNPDTGKEIPALTPGIYKWKCDTFADPDSDQWGTVVESHTIKASEHCGNSQQRRPVNTLEFKLVVDSKGDIQWGSR